MRAKEVQTHAYKSYIISPHILNMVVTTDIFLGPWNSRIFFIVQQSLVGQGLLVIEASQSYSDTPHSVVLLWTSDQPNA